MTAAPTEQRRDAHEGDVSRLAQLEDRIKRLESLIGTHGEVEPGSADFTDVTLADVPAGKIIDRNKVHIDDLQSIIEDIESTVDVERGAARIGGNREQMLSIHRVWSDVQTGGDQALGSKQKRAGRLFGEFIKRVVHDEVTKVDASGQMYVLTSGVAEEVLLGTHDEEADNLLAGVKEASRSQVVARAMRAVADLSSLEDCECKSIDGCRHAVIRFRSGRPNALAAPKQTFHEAMHAAYNETGESSA